MKARRKGVCVVRVRKRGAGGKGQRESKEKNRVAEGKKGSARHAQVLRKSDDLEKGRRQHPGTQA